MLFLELLIWLVAVHYLCDYVFQTDAIATGKNKTIEVIKFGVHWTYWLTSHAFTHGVGSALVVYLFTQDLQLATVILTLETTAHWVIDYCKCIGKLTLDGDQLLHGFCKVWWSILMVIYV